MTRSGAWCALLVLFGTGCDRSQTDARPAAGEVPRSEASAPAGSDGGASLLADLDSARLSTRRQTPAAAASCARFLDVAVAMGVDFRYENGESDQKLMTQATGGGVGWFDYDGDGFPDLLFCQGGSPLRNDRLQNPVDRLYRNLAGARFQDTTDASGLLEQGFSQGVAIGDFDNDGFPDVYVTNVGLDTFYRNLGDGTFIDFTAAAGLINPLWGSSAAWGDLDGDGDLDLYVCNYVDYDPDNPIICYGNDGLPGICHPDEVNPVPNRLFTNQGDGTFADALAAAGLNRPGSKSLRVVLADLNDDRLLDIFVANDTTANHLFLNEGGLRFRESGVQSGCAASGEGLYQASMGVAFGDYNQDGYPDFYCTHFTSDFNTLYMGLGDGVFADVTRDVGLFGPTLSKLGFGAIMADFNCDGRDELFVANGHIDDSFQSAGDRFRMRAQLFAWNGTTWEDVSLNAGPYFEKPLLGRGVATADFDRDGDLDLAVSHQLDAASVLRNDREVGHWCKVRLIGTHSNRTGVGAQVRLTQDGTVRHGWLPGGTSYCAAHEPVVFFGLGASAADLVVEVDWPSGRTSRIDAAAVDQEVLIIEGGPGA